jgi:hypothetical protein
VRRRGRRELMCLAPSCAGNMRRRSGHSLLVFPWDLRCYSPPTASSSHTISSTPSSTRFLPPLPSLYRHASTQPAPPLHRPPVALRPLPPSLPPSLPPTPPSLPPLPPLPPSLPSIPPSLPPLPLSLPPLPPSPPSLTLCFSLSLSLSQTHHSSGPVTSPLSRRTHMCSSVRLACGRHRQKLSLNAASRFACVLCVSFVCM